MFKKLVLLSVILLLSSCVQYTLVDSKAPVTVRGMVLSPSVDWTQLPNAWVKSNVATIWTLDGVQLNQLLILGEVEDGNTIFTTSNKELVMPAYKADMLPNEVEEMVASSLKNLYGGTVSIKTSGLKPQAFGDKKGFAFEIDFFNASDLRFSGKAFATTHNEKLYMIIYLAPGLHYFEKYSSYIDEMVASAKIKSAN